MTYPRRLLGELRFDGVRSEGRRRDRGDGALRASTVDGQVLDSEPPRDEILVRSHYPAPPRTTIRCRGADSMTPYRRWTRSGMRAQCRRHVSRKMGDVPGKALRYAR